MKNITKSFGDNLVLDRVSFSAQKGHVNAVIGENGAGKSTLVKILAGLFEPDSGEIFIDGRRVVINSPKLAQELGISVIYQEITLFQDLSITENVFIRREPLKNPKWIRRIDWQRAYRETGKYLEDFGLDLDPAIPVKMLGSGQQKFVEIIRALSRQAGIIIMDEPTAALTESEIDLLFKAIGDLKKLGIVIIYISHRLEEIKRIADTVTIMRDGQVIQNNDAGEVDIDQIIRAMAGKELNDRYPKLKVKKGRQSLSVRNLSFSGRLKDISFELRRGEILGITGLSGSGRHTLAKVLFGIEGPYEGEIDLGGKVFRHMTPYTAKANGLCYVTGIGTPEGLIANAPIEENISLPNLKRISKAGFIDKYIETNSARDLIDRLEITAGEKDIVSTLSGGKQKKVLFAKWLFSNAKVLIIDEPSAGIDISSKVDVYNIINELVLSGGSIIMLSSDLPEIMGMCDRIAVMCGGQIRKVFGREEATGERILYYASGGT